MSLVRKFSLHSVKVYGVIAVFLTISTQAAADNVAIIGRIDLTGAPPYAALVSSSDDLTPLDYQEMRQREEPSIVYR